MHRLFLPLLVSTALTLPAPLVAEDLPRPKAEYSADSVMSAQGHTFLSKIHAADGKERRELAMEGHQQIMITRLDKRVVWMVMPERKLYTEIPMATAPNTVEDLSGYEFQRTPVGPEQVNGIETTKYRVIITSPEEHVYEGFLWSTAEDILVKLEARGGADHLQLELSNLKIGKQNPSLFEVPAGFKKLPVPGFGVPASHRH